jgi:hypothetical protein
MILMTDDWQSTKKTINQTIKNAPWHPMPIDPASCRDRLIVMTEQ